MNGQRLHIIKPRIGGSATAIINPDGDDLLSLTLPEETPEEIVAVFEDVVKKIIRLRENDDAGQDLIGIDGDGNLITE